MKAQLISQHVYQNKSFILENHHYNNFLKAWHYHPELELVIIHESTGTRFVGDNIEKFEPGEIVLIGKNLPHMWLNDKIYFEGNPNLKAKAHVIHFHKTFASGLAQFPELSCILKLLNKSKRGIEFEDKNRNRDVITAVNDMFNLKKYEKIIKLLEILKCLSDQNDYKTLSSTGYVDKFSEKKDTKILKVYKYIMNNFTQGICLDEAADLINMNPSAFSRYFKRIHKKTFTRYVNEVKVGYACKLLIEQKFNIAEICYKSGFNNVSNFNRQFKSIKEMTPSDFIKLHGATN